MDHQGMIKKKGTGGFSFAALATVNEGQRQKGGNTFRRSDVPSPTEVPAATILI